MIINLILMLLWIAVGSATGDGFWYALALVPLAFALGCAASSRTW